MEYVFFGGKRLLLLVPCLFQIIQFFCFLLVQVFTSAVLKKSPGVRDGFRRSSCFYWVNSSKKPSMESTLSNWLNNPKINIKNKI